MRSGGSTWLLPARSFFIGCGAGLAAAAWNPTNVCPRLLCPLRSIVATLALPSCRHSCRSARVLRGHFGGPFCERACCLDSCLDKTTSSNFKFSSSLKFCCLDAPPPLNGKSAGYWKSCSKSEPSPLMRPQENFELLIKVRILTAPPFENPGREHPGRDRLHH